MGIELINLSNETKAYLNNIRRAIEQLAGAVERKTRQEKVKFVEFKSINGKFFVRADRIDGVSLKGCETFISIGGHDYKVGASYSEVVAKVSDALCASDVGKCEDCE